jgi:hypothetical protein
MYLGDETSSLEIATLASMQAVVNAVVDVSGGTGGIAGAAGVKFVVKRI